MFVLSNSYQLKDTNSDIFTLCFDYNSQISHFVSLDDYHAFASKNELFAMKGGKHKKIGGFRADITALAQCQQLVCAGSMDGEIRIFSEHRTAIRQYKKHEADVTDIAITTGKVVISAGRDNSIQFYDLVEDRSIHRIDLVSEQPRRILETAHGLLVFTKDIALYSLVDYSLIKRLDLGEPIEHAVVFSSNLVIFTAKNKIFALDVNDFKIRCSTLAHARAIVALQAHEDRIYTCSVDGHLKSYNEHLRTISDFNLRSKIVSLSISGGSPYIAMESGKVYTLKPVDPERKKAAIVRKPKAYEDDVEFEVIESAKRQCTELDKLLGNYNYKEAFTKSVKSNDMGQIFHVLKHISDNRSLMKLVKDAEPEFLRDILLVCLETIKIDEFVPIVVELLVIVSSTHLEDIVASEELREILCQVSRELNEVVAFEEVFLKAISFSESFADL